ncbi:Rpn family recombination-promoting nuclease/putative transposase, partial [uncultured Clostridium sp.]
MEKEKVKLDEVLKFLFSTSNKVLVKLLNGIFDEKFDVDEVELTVSNNEFVEDDLGILRGDMFFDILNKNHNKASYHIEFQTKNDNTMVIRMFEYGFKKGKEQLKNSKKFKEEIKTIYFPKQKVIFFEENKSIKNQLKLKIIFPDEQEIIYTVDVIKYWEYTDKELKEKKMYPLMPLQLFNLRKELEKAHNKNDLKKIKELSKKAKNLAEKLAKESAKLFEEDEILGEDFHKMLLAIQNLIEYLNRNYMKD